MVTRLTGTQERGLWQKVRNDVDICVRRQRVGVCAMFRVPLGPGGIHSGSFSTKVNEETALRRRSGDQELNRNSLWENRVLASSLRIGSAYEHHSIRIPQEEHFGAQGRRVTVSES